MKKHIVIAIPAYAGTVHLGTLRSILADTQSLIARGDEISLYDESGSPDLPTLRAQCVAWFLNESKGTHLVFVDHDVCWEAGALLRLVDHGVELVAGAYPKREDPISFPIRYITERPELWADPKTGLLEVEGVQGGFTCCTREMLEYMCDCYADTEFVSVRYPKSTLFGLFDPVRIGALGKLGEDFSFCHRWRALGGQVWIDPNINMAHVGSKAFIGNFGEWLRSR